MAGDEVRHRWVSSTLGHGDMMCSKCKITSAGASAIGLDRCSVEDASGSLAVDRSLAALDEMAAAWAKDVKLVESVATMLLRQDAESCVEAYVRQAWVEGAYTGYCAGCDRATIAPALQQDAETTQAGEGR